MIHMRPQTRAEIDAMINHPVTPPHIKPVLEAVRDYGIGYINLFQNNTALDKEILNSSTPSIIIIGDDTDHSCGPDVFDPLTLRVCTMRAACVAIISSEVVRNIYTMLSLMTGLLRTNTMIIETRPAHEKAWVDYVRSVSNEIPLILSTAMAKTEG